jgi:CheY-like chemotaxis protein
MDGVRADRRPTILLVEDNTDEELLVMRSLRSAPLQCQALCAHSTDEALAFLRCTGSFEGRDTGNPDVIITDLRVGSIGGAELVSAIRKEPQTQLIPIVVLSGAATPTQVEDLYARGANSFIEKPLDSDEFATSIRRLVRYWGQLNSTPTRASARSGRPYTL